MPATTMQTLDLSGTGETTNIIGEDGVASQCALQLVYGGGASGSVIFLGSVNGDDFVQMYVTNLGTNTAVNTANGSGLFRVDTSGLIALVVESVGGGSGTVEVYQRPVLG